MKYDLILRLRISSIVLFLGAACMHVAVQTAHASPIHPPDMSQESGHGGPEKLHHNPGHTLPSVITWKITYADGWTTPICPTCAIHPIPGPPPEPHHIQAAERAFQIWEDLNDNLSFKRVDSDTPRGKYDIHVIFTKRQHPHALGEAVPRNGHDGSIIVFFTKYDCEGRHVEWNSNTLTTVIMHEIGHLLWLKHHIDYDHLMWGAGDEDTQDPFDTLGFNIPERLPEYGVFVGQSELIELDKTVSQTYLGYHLPIQDKINCFYDPAPDKKPAPDDVAPAPGMVPLEIALGLVNEYGTHQRTMEDRLDRLDAGLQSVDDKVDRLEQVANTLKTGLAALQKQFSDLEKAINHLGDRVTSLVNNTPIPTEKPVTIDITAFNDSDGDGIRGIGETAAPNILIITHTPATGQSNLLFTGTDGTVSRDDLPAESFYTIVVPPDDKTATTYPYKLGNSTIYGVLKVNNPAPGSTHQMELGIK